jgi:HSP20 family protein
MLSNPFDFRSSFREMERLRREMNALFDQVDRGPRLGLATGYPAMNIWANADGVIVTAELPGIDLEDLEISVHNNTLTLRGQRSQEEVGEDVTYHRRERGTGQFQRTFQLPYEVEANAVEATYTNGVLQITLPRAEADKPKKIEVRAS